MALRRIMLLSVAGLTLASCGGDSSDDEAGEQSNAPTPTPTPTPSEAPVASLDGYMVYSSPLPDGNVFACATCHALNEDVSDDFRLPGHPIGDALRRQSFKNGQLGSFLASANSCRDEWMSVTSGLWTEESEEFNALTQFIDERDTGEGIAESIVYEIVDVEDIVTEDVLDGDPVLGRETFNGTCAVCHDEDAVGTIRGLPLQNTSRDAEFIAQKVRLSGRTNSNVYDGLIGGVMPFWAADRLSDTELGDIIAFLTNTEVPEEGGQPPIEQPGTGVTPGECGADHPNVGKTATLSTLQHDVSGTVTIVDNCNLRIENFNFDGQGINVDWYAGVRSGTGINYNTDVSLGDIPLGAIYNNETFNLTLPAGISLDDFDGISVWCVPVGISFGDGKFN